ncbi:11491_t:CDS:2, partial [Cetraspora pellucida]
NSLESLAYCYRENDKLMDTRAAGLDIFALNADGVITAIDLDKVENYAQSLNRLGLTDFSTATITAKLGTNKLSDIPAGKTLTDLLTGSGCLLAHCSPAHANYDTIKDSLDAYQDGFRQILELNPTDPLPTDLQNLAVLYNDKSGTQTVPELKTKADDYDRIHTKLSGKVSDDDLGNLLNGAPRCSHSDYDAIKQERDQLKTDKDNHKCDCEAQVKAKETEILTKIITDCKMKPPTDAKDNKIAELEAQVNKLQTPQSLKELKVSEAVKKEIVEISKEFGLTSRQLASASSYQELAILQSQAFKNKLSSEISDKKSAEYLNIGLGVLCMGSLVVLAWMLIKQNKGLKIGGNEEEK